MSEAFILASTNPQYCDRLSMEHGTCCVHKLFWISKQKTICVHSMFLTCSELGIFMYWTRNSMNNLSSYYGLNDSWMSASDTDLPVMNEIFFELNS